MKLWLTLAVCWLLTCFVVDAKPIPATQLFRDTTLSQVKFSPDGQFISVFVNFEDGKGLALYDRKNNDFQLIALVAKSDWVQQYRWLDPQNLYLVSGRDNVMIHSVVSLSRQQNKVTAEVKTVPANGYLVGQLKGSPTRLLFATDVGRSEVEFQLYELSISQLLKSEFPAEARIKHLLDTDAQTRLHFDQQSNRLISTRLDREEQKIHLHFRDYGAQKWQSLFSYNPTDFSFRPLQFLTPDTLAVLSDKNSDKTAVYRFDLKSQQFTQLLFEHPRYDLIDADFSGSELAAVSYFAHGRLEQQFFTSEQQRLQQQLSQHFAKQQWKVLSSVAGQHLLFVFSATNPGQYYLYQPGQKPQLIGDVLPELAEYQLAETIKLQVPAAGGRSIESLLSMPVMATGQQPPALIVMPHGGPIGVQDTDQFDPTVQFLTSRGYAVLRTNFRGSAGYGKSFSESGVAELGSGIEQDISKAVSLVQQQYGIKQACAMGYSYGGYSAMMLAIRQPALYRCVVAGYGIYDLPLLFNASNLKVQPEQQKRVEKVVGPLNPGLKQRSPVYLAAQVQAPALLIAGMEDDIAGFEQSHRMYDALTRAGKDVQTMFYQDTGHGHDRWDLDHHQIGLIEQFLSKHLAAANLHSAKEQAHQWYLQAELLVAGEKLKKDLPAAIGLYQQAAKAGHASAMVALASAAMSGEGLNQDLNVAISYLEQAAKLKDATAELQLGLLYSSNQQQPADQQKANQHFGRAKQFAPDGVAALYLARAACLGWGQSVQITQCIDGLEQHLRRYQQHATDDQSQLLSQTAHRIVAQLLIEARLQPAERDKLIALLNREMTEGVAQQAELSEYRSGFYSGSGYKYEETASYPVDPEQEFGSALKVSRADGVASTPMAWLLVRWQRQLPAGLAHTVTDYPVLVKLNEVVQLHSALTTAVDKKTGDWTLQVYDLKGTRLYQQQFNFKS